MRGARRRNAFDRVGWLRRAVRPTEAAQVRRLGRSILSLTFRTPVLLLHTTGRRSGKERTTVLAYHRDADASLLVVGGAGGQTQIPDWVQNLRRTPNAAVTLDRLRFPVHAEELCGAERSAVWDRLASVWPRITTYERRAGRATPVFRLSPTPPSKRVGRRT